MICSEKCEVAFYDCPSRSSVEKEGVPRCKKCGAFMKHHCMFFDECYSEELYKDETVREFVHEADGLIVIGTALATGLAYSLVRDKLLKQDIPIIEVNS